MRDPSIDTKHADAGIPTTRWSIVQAMGSDGTKRQAALEVFATDYWPAIYAFARKKGCEPLDAEDLTQSFLLSLLESDSFEGLGADKGRFRSWLLACLHNFLRVDWRAKKRLKRGGGVKPVSIDRDLGEAWLEMTAADEASPDVIFERRWAAGILERALDELAAFYEREGKVELARLLAPMVVGEGDGKGYAEVAQQLGISEANARVAAFRLRKRLRSLIREEVAATVESPTEVDDELDYLFAVFGGGGQPRRV
jgi:RNA polymerase sigma factor (sigma-70 family)